MMKKVLNSKIVIVGEQMNQLENGYFEKSLVEEMTVVENQFVNVIIQNFPHDEKKVYEKYFAGDMTWEELNEVYPNQKNL